MNDSRVATFICVITNCTSDSIFQKLCILLNLLSILDKKNTASSTMENSQAASQKVKQNYSMTQKSRLEVHTKIKIESTDPNRYSYTGVQSIIHNSRKGKHTSCPSTDQWVNRSGLCVQWSIIQP